MKKANQAPGTAQYIENDLEGLLGFLDQGARKRKTFKQNLEGQIARSRGLESTIAMATTDLEKSKADTIKMQAEFDAMPEAGMTIEEARELLLKISNLPWIEKIELDANMLTLFTRDGVLKTNFYNRMVIGDGNRANELLETPVLLPLPKYEIKLDLRNMGSTWAVNAALSIHLANPIDYSDFQAEEGGWIHEPRAHWGCNNNDAGWGTLCLGDYDNMLFKASKQGLYELLIELAIYLQNSGWSSAYVNKVAWATLLGNPVYNKHLLRGFAPGETVDGILQDTRKRLAEFLKANNLTSNMYHYGSNSSDDDEDRTCYDCECEEDYDDECTCDCHI